MSKKELEILPCPQCKEIPIFLTWPSEEFPVMYYPVCPCANSQRRAQEIIGNYRYKNRHKLTIRKGTKRSAILRWNRITRPFAFKYELPKVTCKFCKRDDLLWGKRPYASAWRGRKLDYVLYERVETGKTHITIAGKEYKQFRLVIHNCLSVKNIVSVTYTQD
jgi:hypothetical protein